jgi:hypothetical protein
MMGFGLDIKFDKFISVGRKGWGLLVVCFRLVCNSIFLDANRVIFNSCFVVIFLL